MLHLPVVLSHHTLTHIHRSVNPTEMGGTGLAHGASSWGSRLCEWVLLNCSFICLLSVLPNAESSPHC